MPAKKSPSKRKRPAKQETGGGCPGATCSEFAGIQALIQIREALGDPYGKLMQDEVADRIQKLVNVLRETVGLMDSLKIAATAPAMTKADAMMMRICYRSIEHTLNEAMPEWDAVCKAIDEANDKDLARRALDSE
jgi:hypothetical protein